MPIQSSGRRSCESWNRFWSNTNVIIECHVVDCWSALAGGMPLETVSECVRETQTGFQRRRPEHRIDEQLLRQSLSAVHDVSDEQRAVVFADGGNALDPGERDLWAHALTRQDAWILCGPDRTSMRFGFKMGMKDRLVSLAELLVKIRYKPKQDLRAHFEKAWLQQIKNQLILDTL